MSLDPRIPMMAGQSQVNLADLYREAQQFKAWEEDRATVKQQRADQQQSRITEQQRAEAAQIAKLTAGVTDEATYQQRLAAARTFGIDVSGAPQNYDPNWVQTQNTIANILLKPDAEQKLSTAAQQAQELTGKPISDPETRKVMARLLADNVPVQAGGAVYTNDPIAGFAPAILPNPGTAQAGAPVGGDIPTISSPDEAKRLPPGSQFRTPDGRLMRVPGGSGGNAGGNFPSGQ